MLEGPNRSDDLGICQTHGALCTLVLGPWVRSEVSVFIGCKLMAGCPNKKKKIQKNPKMSIYPM